MIWKLKKYLKSFNFRTILYPIVKILYKSIENGAQTQIMLAIEPKLEKVSGKFFVNCKEKEISARARDEETGEWLWEHSKKVTKFREN